MPDAPFDSHNGKWTSPFLSVMSLRLMYWYDQIAKVPQWVSTGRIQVQPRLHVLKFLPMTTHDWPPPKTPSICSRQDPRLRCSILTTNDYKDAAQLISHKRHKIKAPRFSPNDQHSLHSDQGLERTIQLQFNQSTVRPLPAGLKKHSLLLAGLMDEGKEDPGGAWKRAVGLEPASSSGGVL